LIGRRSENRAKVCFRVTERGVQKKKTAILLTMFLLLFLPTFLFGQSSRGDALTLKVAVIGPGDELYFWWGHIGLVVEDRISGTSRFFDWGVFSFENENFFLNFAFGRLIYTCAVSKTESNFNHFIRTNRDITIYTLDLPSDRKEAVLRFAENNMLPENRDYNYHHFKDNCATRIRDIIDLALDGRFKEEFINERSRFTLRQHVRRHTWFSPFIDWILNFWMGQDIDKPITVWDDMFLPSEIGMRITDYQYRDSYGNERNLVSQVEILNKSVGRPIVLEVPRKQWPRELFVSLVFSGLLVFVYLFYGKKKPKEKFIEIFFGLTQSFLGLFFGLAGSLLFFLTFFTDHDYAYHNSNVFFVNPLFLAAIPLGLIFAFTHNKKKRFIAALLLRAFWICIFLGGLLTMAIKLSPAFYQQNQVTQALVLPIALTMIVLMGLMGRLKKQ
jgi:hypothetical protein